MHLIISILDLFKRGKWHTDESKIITESPQSSVFYSLGKSNLGTTGRKGNEKSKDFT